MARLLENQAKELLRESTSMASGDVEGFAAVAFPIVRRVFAGLIANDLVSVQPMSLPSGLIFFLDFTFSGDLAGSETQDRRFGNLKDKSIYGTDQVGSQVTGGVDLVGPLGGDLSGPRTSARGYAYASPSGSLEVAAASQTATVINLSGAISDSDKKKIQFDPDLLALVADPHAVNVLEVEIAAAAITANTQMYASDRTSDCRRCDLTCVCFPPPLWSDIVFSALVGSFNYLHNIFYCRCYSHHGPNLLIILNRYYIPRRGPFRQSFD